MPPGIKRRRDFDPLGDVSRTQDLTREGVVANAELLRPELLARIGDTLGGLNSIGALRSGGTKVALDEVSRDFTDRIGSIASQATLGAIDSGLNATSLRLRDEERRQQSKEARKRRKAGLLSSIGSVVGAGRGFAVAGPPGAAAGSGV